MKLMTIIMAVMMAVALCACTGQDLPEPSSTPEVEASVIITEPEEISPLEPQDAARTPQPAPETAAPQKPEAEEGSNAPPVSDEEKLFVQLYHGDENYENIISKEVEIDELSPQLLMDMLFQEGVFSQSVSVNSFTVDNYNIIHLDLSEQFGDMLKSTGTTGEFVMVGSLVNTFLSAFEADGLCFTLEGEILETGHSIYDFTINFF